MGQEVLDDVRLLFPNKYIGAADLRGKDVTLTIASVHKEDLRTNRGSDKKPVVRFQELANRSENEPHLWVLNKTNAMAIAEALGSYEVRNWIGKRITLFATQCEAFGETVDCVRVRPTAPAQKQEPAPANNGLDDYAESGRGLF